MTFYISIQPLDYDDYATGMETKIGPFASYEAAVEFMTKSDNFIETKYNEKYSTWRLVNRSRGSVTVKNLLNTHMIAPEMYDARA